MAPIAAYSAPDRCTTGLPSLAFLAEINLDDSIYACINNEMSKRAAVCTLRDAFGAMPDGMVRIA